METTSSRRTSPTHRYIGLTLGIMGIIVSAVVIYGVGGPLFPQNMMTQTEREKGNYENFVGYLAKLHFLSYLVWLFAVFTDTLFALILSFGLWLLGLGYAVMCACFYYLEDIPREFKDREVFLIAGTAYWTFSLIIAGIWCVTRKMDDEPVINETELTPIK